MTENKATVTKYEPMMESLFNTGVNEPLQVQEASVGEGFTAFSKRGSDVLGPESPLNTSGTEQDAGFAQEDFTIYDRKDKREVASKTERLRLWLHTSVCM